LATVAKALGDPVRLQLIDVLRKHAGKVCVCELVPLFDLSQPTISHHLKVLRQAALVGSERQGLWAYYYVIPETLKELSAWLSSVPVSAGPSASATPKRPGHSPAADPEGSMRSPSPAESST
jgi:ArsR family transcriptional regulator